MESNHHLWIFSPARTDHLPHIAYTYVFTGFYALLRQLTLDNLNPSVLYNPKGAIQTAIAPTPITVSRNVSTST